MICASFFDFVKVDVTFRLGISEAFIVDWERGEWWKPKSILKKKLVRVYPICFQKNKFLSLPNFFLLVSHRQTQVITSNAFTKQSRDYLWRLSLLARRLKPFITGPGKLILIPPFYTPRKPKRLNVATSKSRLM